MMSESKEEKMTGEEDRVGNDTSDEKAAPSSIMKYISLTVLVVQYTTFTLTVRYSRTVKGDMYISSTVIVLSEWLKLMACLIITLFEKRNLTSWFQMLYTDIIADYKTTLKVGVPAFIYVIQNNLPYIAMSHIDAATFQVLYQIRLLTTAIFAVVMLKKKLSIQQWISLFLLFVGIAAVQLKPDFMQTNHVNSEGANPMIALLAILVGSLCSGFAGVYFEKILKNTAHGNKSIWLRNIQLGFFGFIIGIIGMFVKDRAEIQEKGMLYGYNNLVWCVVSLQAFSGLVVALVLTYADNVLKGFATSLSIILACVASTYLFDFIITMQFAVGTVLVLIAVILYALPKSLLSYIL